MPTNLPRLTVNIEALITNAEYKQHPYGKTHERLDEAIFGELCADVDRRGLDRPITLYQGMVLDGWHRYLACLATKTTPKLNTFSGTDVQAAELVHASEVRRHATPEQRNASFTLLCDACPAFKAKFEDLAAKGQEQKKAGKPLATDSQRVDVVKTKAEAVGVSKATAKKVERVKKTNPKAVAEIAAGKTTANKEAKKLQVYQPEEVPSDGLTPNDGDTKETETVYYLHSTFREFEGEPPHPHIVKVQVRRTATRYRRVSKGPPYESFLALDKCFGDRSSAVKAVLPRLQEWINDKKAEIKEMEEELRDGDKALARYRSELTK